MATERVVLACVVLLAGSQPATPWPNEPAEWSRQWRGSLGTRLKIEMELDRSYGGLSGSYTYEPSKDRLLLEGHVEDDGTVALTEQTADGDETGRFEGRFDVQGSFTGTWRDAKGLRALRFVLTPVPNPPQGAAKEWQGRWHEDAGTGEIVIKALADGRIRALGWKTVEVGTAGGEPYANIGHFHAIGRVQNGVVRLRDGGCRVTLALREHSLHVEADLACGGAGVTFSGDYH
jgi:hypothetical protein